MKFLTDRTSSYNVNKSIIAMYFLNFLHRPYVFQPQRFEGWLFPRQKHLEMKRIKAFVLVDWGNHQTARVAVPQPFGSFKIMVTSTYGVILLFLFPLQNAHSSHALFNNSGTKKFNVAS
jgi:hypothetical protein